jgi:hypothetical protein
VAAVPRRRLGLLVAGCVALMLAIPAVAGATKIKGKLANFHELVNPVWHEAKDPKRRGYSFREIVPTVPAKFRRLFPHIPKEICVAALATDKQEADRKPLLIRVGGGRTTPVTIVVPPGTRLRFRNTDPFTHRLYIKGQTTFPAENTISGAQRDWAVPGPGVFEVRDEAAPSLRTWIIAEPNVAATVYPSMKGEFALVVPVPGEYTIQSYFAGQKVGDPVPITVETRDIDLSKEPIKVAPDPKKKKKDDDKDEK